MGLGVSSEPQKTNGAKNEGQTESIWDLMGTGKGNEPSLREALSGFQVSKVRLGAQSFGYQLIEGEGERGVYGICVDGGGGFP